MKTAMDFGVQRPGRWLELEAWPTSDVGNIEMPLDDRLLGVSEPFSALLETTFPCDRANGEVGAFGIIRSPAAASPTARR